MLGVGELLELRRQLFARRRIRQHLEHFRRAPDILLRVVVVHHGHHRQIDGCASSSATAGRPRALGRGRRRACHRPRRRAALPGSAGRDRDSATGAKPGSWSRRSRRRRRAADRNSAAPCRAPRLCASGPRYSLGFSLARMATQAGVRIRAQKFRQLGIAANVEQENDQHKREKSAGDFQREPGSAPAAAFLIVENGLAFRHRDNPS